MVETSSKRPADSDFYQQRLKAWQPILTPKWVVISFAIVGIVFLPLGFVLKAASDSVVEVKVKYDAESSVTSSSISGDCHIAPDDYPTSPVSCSITITPDEDMEPPIYVYYELENFYQNHRRYVKSRSDEQLKGDFPGASLGDCDPLKRDPITGKVLWPCGLIANSMFNDTITVDASSGFSLDEKDIAWESDRDTKFENVPWDTKNASRAEYKFLDEIYPGVIPTGDVPENGVENEHFIVWMRTAALPKFRKLYGRIHKKIRKGESVQFDIGASFKVSSFDGTKSLVVSTSSWLGGKNPFLGIAYIVVGALCLALAAFFFAKQKISGRLLGDTNKLVWNSQ